MKNALANWPMTLFGFVSAIFGIIQVTKVVPWYHAFLDPVTQLALISAALGFFGKWQGMTGTAANPRAEYQVDPVPKSDVVPPPTRVIPADVLPPKPGQ